MEIKKEDIIKKPTPVLDFGYVELIDYLGSDKLITDSARVSYKQVKTRTEDAQLIDYLMRNNHTSPFEQVVFTFRLKMPIFVARQWVRHRTARMNEVSARYSVMNCEFYRPDEENLNAQSKSNRQGRGDKLPEEEAEKVLKIIDDIYKKDSEAYTKLLDLGLSKEIARIVLPLSLYTEFYWQMDLHNLFHFLSLRLDKHAQLEIREYAKILLSFVEKVCPLATASFRKHILNSTKISEDEKKAIGDSINIDSLKLDDRQKRILSEKFN